MLVKAPHDAKAKREVLRQLLRNQDNVKNGIVFANRKTTVALLEKSLRTHGFNAGALHGDMDQSARLKMLQAFRNNEVTYLIASDVAARGLDIPEVSHVFNFDVPTHAEDYVHRIGRTGRAGREGQAFTLVTKEEGKYWKAIEALIKKEIPYFDLGNQPTDETADDGAAEAAREERRPRRGREAKPRGERAPRAPRKASPESPAAEPAADAPVAEPAAAARPPREAREPRPQQTPAAPRRAAGAAPRARAPAEAAAHRPPPPARRQRRARLAQLPRRQHAGVPDAQREGGVRVCIDLSQHSYLLRALDTGCHSRDSSLYRSPPLPEWSTDSAP